MAHMIAGVAVEKAGFHFDKLYSYLVPDRLALRAQVGERVLVPFGKGNGRSIGVIFTVTQSEGMPDVKLKPVIEFPDREPVASKLICDMAVWLKEHTFCTLFDGVRAQLPTGINLKITTEYRLSRKPNEKERDKLTQNERTLIFCLLNSNEPLNELRLHEAVPEGCDIALASLIKKGIICRTEEAVRTLGDASVKVVSLVEDRNCVENYFAANRSIQQRKVYEFLVETGTASVKEVIYFTGVTASVIRTLEKHGIVIVADEEVYRRPEKEHIEQYDDGELTAEQKAAVDGLYALYCKDEPAAALLYGVTGSGKTRVYTELIRKAVNEGKNCIVMVPEISLTPQTAAMFYGLFGDKVAIVHSALSMGERTDEWKRIRRGEASIALGTRSAVFAPFDRVSLIIMDEEQDAAYKSQSNPRYNARDAAKYLATRDSALLVMGSATPSVESFYAAQNGKYQLFTMHNRYNNALLPKVEICSNDGDKAVVIGKALEQEINANIALGEQTILLHNRRGFNTVVKCSQCGEIYTCPNCSVSLTYHSANRRLMCHYCGYTCLPDVTCRSCGSWKMVFSGFGTQRVEDELAQKFPTARVARMDADTTACKNGHGKLLSEFAAGKYDILIGTQMVAKGLNFPNVTLVGVLNADQTLYCDDFRAYERAFALLTQVAGRSGRGDKPGRALIQTFTPENPVFEQAARQDYDSFSKEELARRRALTYPPFCDICEVTFFGQTESRVKAAAARFFTMLVQHCADGYASMPIRVLNPSPATVSKIGNNFYYRLIIKCRNNSLLRRFVAELLTAFAFDKAYKGVTAAADINPSAIV